MSKALTAVTPPILDTSGISGFYVSGVIHKITFDESQGYNGKKALTWNEKLSTKELSFSLNGLDAHLQLIYKQVQGNSIVDADKVFFTKNSEFPRSSFNKYSEGARRVELTKNATKYVVSPNRNFMYESSRWNDAHYYRCKADGVIHEIDVSMLMDRLDQTDPSNMPKFKGSKLSTLSNHNYYSHIRDFSELWAKEWSKLQGKEFEEVFPHLFQTTKQEETFKILLAGIPVNSIVLDKEANRYLDTFKRELDEKNVEMLTQLLKGDPPNVTLGLKLLENLDITNSRAYLYATMLNAFDANESNIRSNKSWNSVGIKNMRSHYNLSRLRDFRYASDDQKIYKMGAFYKELPAAEGTAFRTNIEQLLLKTLQNSIGNGGLRLIKDTVENHEST